MYAIRSYYGLPGGTPAISTNNKIRKMLADTLGEISFADLQIPLAVVTTDLVTRKLVITSYSIHYTKLYETASSFGLSFPRNSIDSITGVSAGSKP